MLVSVPDCRNLRCTNTEPTLKLLRVEGEERLESVLRCVFTEGCMWHLRGELREGIHGGRVP